MASSRSLPQPCASSGSAPFADTPRSRKAPEPGRMRAENGKDRTMEIPVEIPEIPRRSEILPPIATGGKNRGAGPFFCVAGLEVPPQDWVNTENVEKVGREGGNGRAGGLR